MIFVGPLIPLFWTSGDVCSGFQSQGRFLACLLFACALFLRFNSGATPADCWHSFVSSYDIYQKRICFFISKRIITTLGDFLCITTPNTGQMNPLFHTFAEFSLIVNRIVVRQSTDWSAANAQFSPNERVFFLWIHFFLSILIMFLKPVW